MIMGSVARSVERCQLIKGNTVAQNTTFVSCTTVTGTAIESTDVVVDTIFIGPITASVIFSRLKSEGWIAVYI